MDMPALLNQASGAATTVVDGVSAAELTKPTPCTEWDVRGLINHMTGVAELFAVAVETGSVTPEQAYEVLGKDALGDDHKAAWRAAAERSTAAYAKPGLAEETVTLANFGDLSGQVLMSIALLDLTTHLADLAHATGQPMPPAELCEVALGIAAQMLAEHRDPNQFDPEQPVAADAPAADRLLAFTGRKI